MPQFSYYYNTIQRVFKFIIPNNKRILYYGFTSTECLTCLEAELLICVDPDIPKAISQSNLNCIEFVEADYDTYVPDEVFDYIILDFALGQTSDIAKVLGNVRKACHPHSRILIHQQNYLWQGVLNLFGRLGIKKKEKTQNWLSFRDLNSYLDAMGLESTRSFRSTIFPLKLWFIGPIVNSIFKILPFLDFLKLDQFIVARAIDLNTSESRSLTICITVRNEGGNIEQIVQSLPKVCETQEILFVEGHSTDNTREEVERMIGAYPDKNIRLITQEGKGQGDAIRIGFKKAKGDIIILYEGDGTSYPDDVLYFYEAMAANRFQFIEGSRFVYPLNQRSMPFLNKVGNIFFATWFSWMLGQHVTDVLSGIKAINKKDYDLIESSWGFLGMEDPFGDFELLYGSVRYGLKIGEIPMRYRPRTYGESKTSVFKHGFYLLKMAMRGYLKFRIT